jgi:hypothetical protein
MAATRRSVFRAQAFEQYVRGREQSVLPRFVGPRAFGKLWASLGVLGLVGLLALMIRLPVYTTGSAVAVESSLAGLGPEGGPVVVALLPAESLSRLEIGQEMTLQAESSARPLHVPIVAIEDDLRASDQLRRRFRLGPGVALVTSRPVAVAIGRMPDGEQPQPAPGTLYRVHLRVGSRPILALVPVLGSLVDEG